MNSEIDVTKRKLKRLYFKGGNKNIEIPNWGYFFIELGELISQLVADDFRSIIALAVPARNFSSSLISFGNIVRKLQSSQNNDYLKYAEYLKTLPPGTPILLRSEVGKKFKGLLNGYVAFDNTLHFAVQYEQSATRYIKIDESMRIEVLNTDVNLKKTQKGRTLASETDFCVAILGSKCASLLVTESKLETVIIGPKKSVEAEVTTQEFLTHGGQTGTLQEILRVREFQNENKSSRSRIISDKARAVTTHSGILDPPLVIFDGAQGFLKWRSYWTASNWVIVLDQTEYQFEAAVEQVKREFHYRKDNCGLEITSLDIPAGIEAMSFGVGR